MTARLGKQLKNAITCLILLANMTTAHLQLLLFV